MTGEQEAEENSSDSRSHSLRSAARARDASVTRSTSFVARAEERTNMQPSRLSAKREQLAPFERPSRLAALLDDRVEEKRREKYKEKKGTLTEHRS